MRCVRFEEQGRARIGFIDGDVIRAVYGLSLIHISEPTRP